MILQAGVVDIVALVNIKLNLMLILLVFFSIYCSGADAVITSFVIGFASDVVGPVMGPQTISFCLFGTLLAYLHGFIAFKTMPYQSLAIAVTGVLAGITALLLSVLKGHPVSPDSFIFLLGASLYSAIVGPFLFLPAAWWMRVKEHRFVRI
jgi:rod shape-determining protein MreD